MLQKMKYPCQKSVAAMKQNFTFLGGCKHTEHQCMGSAKPHAMTEQIKCQPKDTMFFLV
jgi:hypothetical protein